MGCDTGSSTPTVLVGAFESALLVEIDSALLVETGLTMIDADVVGSWDNDVEVGAIWTGSTGVSSPLPGSLCNPIVFRGSRRVPLFGAGTIPTESHRMLYTSMFSDMVSKETMSKKGSGTYEKVRLCCWACEGRLGLGR